VKYLEFTGLIIWTKICLTQKTV